MKAARKVLVNLRLRRETGWALLSLEHAPVALGLLQAYLGGRDRRLPGSILLERLKHDLETLRAHGLELPQTAETYLANWLRAGYLVRTFPPGAPEEEYELSTEAGRAIRFIESLERPRAVATETRLSLVIQQLQQLAEQTEADPQARLEVLLRERARLDAQIEAVRRGCVETLPEERALERINEVAELARELLGDFRRVRDEFARINRGLREQIVENEGSRGEVLDKIFAGVDLVAESEAGRTFRAFWRLLTDPEQALAFEEALEKVLSRDFAHRLVPGERRFLLRLTRELLDNAGEVHDVLQQFARGLKQFVQSQAYREQRRLHRLLQVAQQRARKAKDRVRPAGEIGTTLYLTSADLDSVAQWQLHDPGEEAAAEAIQPADELALSLETVGELLVYSEIDFRRLREQVTQLLKTRPQVSVAEVLEVYPARQGLGSVVGLMSLASREGIKGEGQDRVCWRGRDGVERCALIPRLYFVREAHARTG